MRLRALAKINLGLDILRKREDGYHEVRMIMRTIQMYDVLEMKRVRKPGIPARRTRICRKQNSTSARC